MTVYYEWDVEVLASEETKDHFKYDVVEHLHKESFQECLDEYNLPPVDGYEKLIVLVRDDDNGRSWCSWCPIDKKLDEYFYDAFDRKVCKVPKRFIKETGGMV